MIKTEKVKGGLAVAIKGNDIEISMDMYHIGKTFTTDDLSAENKRLKALASFLAGFEVTEEEILQAMLALNFAKEVTDHLKKEFAKEVMS